MTGYRSPSGVIVGAGRWSRCGAVVMMSSFPSIRHLHRRTPPPAPVRADLTSASSAERPLISGLLPLGPAHHAAQAGTGAIASTSGSERAQEVNTMSSQPAPIVVGYDSSPGSQSALRWAVGEAVRGLAPLRILEAFELIVTVRPSPGHVVPLDALRTARQKEL